MERIGRERGGIVLVELDQRAHQIGGTRVRRRVCIGLELVPARVQGRQRLEEKREHRDHEEE